MDLVFRCSSLGKIMPGSKGLTDNQQKTYNDLMSKEEITEKQLETLKDLHEKKKIKLSPGAITEIHRLVDEKVYGINTEVDTRPMKKGKIQEDVSINLYNDLFGTNYTKNVGRVSNGFITGECDILHKPDNIIIDIKSSWDKITFPKTEAEISSSLYEWQGRGYMMLYDVDNFELAYVLVDTPDQLIKYENIENHKVSDLDPRLRVTTKRFTRDKSKEVEIVKMITLAKEEAKRYYNELINKNKINV